MSATDTLPHVAAHPALAPFAEWLPPVGATALPSLGAINAWARATGLALPDGRPLAFVAPASGASSALAYEARVAQRGEVATRGNNLHDVWNALAWLAFPRTKAALNAVHVAAARAPTPNARDRRRDAATLLDESGLIVACIDPELIAGWRAHRWREAFVVDTRRARPALTALAIGHGLLAKLAAPYRGITGRALIVPVDPTTLPRQPDELAGALDAAAATAIAALAAAFSPERLPPLPVAALPDWDLERLGPRLFDDVAVFRPFARATITI